MVNAMPGGRELALTPLDPKVDHVRGSLAGHLIIEYGDYECPYSRQAFHAIEQASGQVLGTPTLFIDGVVHRGGYDPPALLAALAA